MCVCVCVCLAALVQGLLRGCDAIGTPFCITVDDNTLNDDIVTLRFRDSMQQINLHIDELVEYINKQLEF